MEHLRGTTRPVADEPTDGELLERFVTDRDEDAFVELVRRHGPLVHGVCRRMLDNAQDVEDAFQATFMVLVRKADSIRKRDSAASWLYGVALRVARRARASLTRRRQRERRAAVPEAVASADESWPEIRPVLDEAVDTLPEKYRVLVVLCYLQGRTYDEAARLLDLAKGTVSTRLTQARSLLRHRLTRRGLVLPVAVLVTLLEQNAAPAAVPPQLLPLAVEAARSVAGIGGSVAPHVAALAQAALGGKSLVKPGVVALLALLLAACGAGLWSWRALFPTRQGTNTGETQTWQPRFSVPNQRFLVYNLHFSPDGKLLAGASGDYMLKIWDTTTNEERARIQLESDMEKELYGRCLGFTADSRALVVAGSDVRLYDVAAWEVIAHYPGGSAAQLAPDGKTLATVAADGTVHLIDLAEKRDRTAAERLPGKIVVLALSSDGRTLAAGAKDGTVYLIDASTLERRGRLTGNALPTLDLAFSPDGTTLATLHGRDIRNEDGESEMKRQVKIWQIATDQSRTLPSHPAMRIGFAPRSQSLVTAEERGWIACWDPATGEQRVRFGTGMMRMSMLRLVFSPDGESVLSADSRGNLRVQALADGRVLATLGGHAGMVVDAAFAPDGRTLAAGTMSQSRGNANQQNSAELKVWERVK